MAPAKFARSCLSRTPVTVGEALRDYSCIVIADALPPSDSLRSHEILRELFSQSLDAKLKYKAPRALAPGFGPYGRARALDTGIPNLLETWDISLSEPINWPSSMLDGWRFLVGFQEILFGLAYSVLGSIATGLRSEAEQIQKLVSPEHGGIHLIHYPSIGEGLDPGARRQSKHCDMTIITLIPAPSGEGLNICLDGKWIAVHLEPGECLVQAGVLLTYLTGGLIPASLHTVESPKEAANLPRFSTPFFLSPRPDSILEPLPECVGLSQEDYPPKAVEDIQRQYFVRIFGDDVQGKEG